MTSTPTFVFNRVHAIAGAQTAATLVAGMCAALDAN